MSPKHEGRAGIPLAEATREELVQELSARCATLVLGGVFFEGEVSMSFWQLFGCPFQQIGLGHVLGDKIAGIAERVGGELDEHDEDSEEDGDADDE